MTNNDVLRMAREAGIPDDNIPSLCHGRLETGVELLERFAALVAAHEREGCAVVVLEAAKDGERLDWLFNNPMEALDILGYHRVHELQWVREEIDTAMKGDK